LLFTLFNVIYLHLISGTINFILSLGKGYIYEEPSYYKTANLIILPIINVIFQDIDRHNIQSVLFNKYYLDSKFKIVWCDGYYKYHECRLKELRLHNQIRFLGDVFLTVIVLLTLLSYTVSILYIFQLDSFLLTLNNCSGYIIKKKQYKLRNVFIVYLQNRKIILRANLNSLISVI